ncbi:hypothetical protein [Streptomyces sp. NPDC005017]|uniref:hypothetical protein n=1 Tax=Streptomyces sp. NPDC005017 TaxID=3364706 RepID=UPI003690F7BD
MERRRLLALSAVAAAPLAAGCSSRDGEAGPPSSAGARQAVEAYVEALNSRDATALIAVGGVEDETWSRREAARILAERGGRRWRIREVEIGDHMGPDVGSARLVAGNARGEFVRDTFTVMREGGSWHLAVFTRQPAPPGKESSSTDGPTA